MYESLHADCLKRFCSVMSLAKSLGAAVGCRIRYTFVPTNVGGGGHGGYIHPRFISNQSFCTYYGKIHICHTSILLCGFHSAENNNK